MNVDQDKVITAKETTAELSMDVEQLDENLANNFNMDDLVEYDHPDFNNEKEDSELAQSKLKSIKQEISQMIVNSDPLDFKTTSISATSAIPTIENENISTTITTPMLAQPKIAPKPIVVSKLANSPGQIVIIQSPSGAQQQVRIASTSNNTSTYHRFIPINNSKTLNTGVLSSDKKTIIPNVKNQIGKFIVKSSGQKIIIAPQNKNLSTIGNAKSLSVSQAQQLGLISPTKLKPITVSQKPKQILPPRQPAKILPAPASGSSITMPLLTKIKTTSSSQPTTQQPKILIQQTGKTIYTKTITGPGGKQIFVPQGMKLSTVGQNTTPIHAINIPGKGIQYVRLVSAVNTSTSASTPLITTAVRTTATATTPVTASAGLISTTGISTNQNKLSVANSTKSLATTSSGNNIPQKIFIQGKSGQTLALIQPNNKNDNKLNPQKTILQTIPIQKKIIPFNRSGGEVQSNLIAVVRKDCDTSVQTLKIENNVNHKLPSITTSQLSQLQGATIVSGTNKSAQIVMLPVDYVQQLNQNNSNITNKVNNFNNNVINNKNLKQDVVNNIVEIKKERSPSIESLHESFSGDKSTASDKLNDTNGKRKSCNCTKSQCLKLYCDCFAAGDFCHNCNCKECFNNLENEYERQKAIRICLDRNPNAFRPKIGKAKDQNDTIRKHTKGCNCKRSGCLKNYCECYEAKIACSYNCKCYGCRNDEGGLIDRNNSNSSSYKNNQQVRGTKRSFDGTDALKIEILPQPSKQPYNLMTSEVIDATVQCMLAQAEECQQNGTYGFAAEKIILEEFGKCLIEIIDFSNKNADKPEII